MSEYLWDSRALREVFLLPAAVEERSLMANAEQLRVLLWLARHRMEWDAVACGGALRLTPEEAQGALDFWGDLLAPDGTAPLAAAPEVPAAPSPAVTEKATPRPRAVKPLIGEVLEYQRTHPEFSELLETASARLGKPIGHGDTATLLYLLSTVGLPMEVILMEIVYAVSVGKGNMRYVEKLALDWADRDLTTVESVDRHIRYLENCRKIAARLEGRLLLPTPLTVAQSQTAEKWVNEWQFSDDMIAKAEEIAREKTGKFSPAYMDKVLESWHQDGIRTPDGIPKPDAKKGAAATNPEVSTLNTDDFEKDLMRYRPKFNKTKT